MKKLFLLLLLVSITATSQNNSSETKFYQLTEIDVDPTYNGCTQLNFEECSTKKIIELLQDSINKELFTTLQPDDAVIIVKLIISDIGKVERVMVQGKNKKLEEECLKILNNLEAFKPAIKDGRNVNVIIDIPIQLDLEINDYDTRPIIKNCINSNNPNQCTSKSLQDIFLSNINTERVLKKKSKISIVLKLEIDENGIATNKTEEFEDVKINREFDRVIKLLPLFIPAVKNGENINYIYEIPITGQRF